MKKKGYETCLGWLTILLCLAVAIVCVATGNGDGLLVLAQLGSIIVGSISVLMMLYLIRPRRGVHYVYWNRYLLVFGALLLIIPAGGIIPGYLLLKFDLFDTDTFSRIWGTWLVVVVPGFFLWFKLFFLPAWGLWRLQLRYPKMVRSARRLKRPGLNYMHAWFAPLILVRGKPYLLAGYGQTNMPPFTSFSTLDEEGRFVTDETLVETMMRGYKLAIVVLHSETSLHNAREIERFKSTRRWMQKTFPRLHANEAYFREAGGEVYESWQHLAAFEQNVDTILATRVERGMWLAGWALDHGLNRLTEISEDQLHEVEARLAQFDAVLASCTGQTEGIRADAEALQGSLTILADPLTNMDGKRIPLQHRRTLKKLLKRLAEFCQLAAVWQQPADDFRPTESEWRTWQRSKEIAEISARREERRRNRYRSGF